MSGNLAGILFRVIGRVVMAVDEGGKTYYWNEFNLTSESGRRALLVYEKTGGIGEWKLFTLFEPKNPITAQEAAQRKVGDNLDLDGKTLSVALVDRSRVAYVEGETTESARVGDLANYFNAVSGNTMIVVTWTGPDVEFYRGVTIPDRTVALAFGFVPERAGPLLGMSLHATQDAGRFPGARNYLVPAIVVAIIAVAFFTKLSSCDTQRISSAPRRTIAPEARLQTGSLCSLEGRQFRVITHSLMRISTVAALYDRHEYHLLDSEGGAALLIQGRGRLTLLTPLQSTDPLPLTPARAAELRMGNIVNVNGLSAIVTELFQAVVLKIDTSTPETFHQGEMLFGFTARTNSTQLLARWTAIQIEFYQGRDLSDKEMRAAFPAK